MAGKQAKLLCVSNMQKLIKYASNKRYGKRNQVIVLLSIKAGLRACEIANLTWDMVLTADNRISDFIELNNSIAKKGSGRIIPLNKSLKKALISLRKETDAKGYIIKSERGNKLKSNSIVNWFAEAYKALGLKGCSSHSGRRTFITKAARSIYRAGGSLRDVQLLAGHRSIDITQRYIEGSSPAQKRLVQLM